MNLNENIGNVLNRLTDWCQYSKTGNAVADLPLDLLNRGKDWISGYHQWDFLIKVADLVLSSGTTYTVPIDCQAIIDIYTDCDGDGQPHWRFCKDATDISKRYTIADAFTATGGHSRTITFPSSAYLSSTPKIKYSALLADYVGTKLNGAYTELCFFPANLMLRAAQKIHCEDKGRSGDDVISITKALWDEMRIAEAMLQHQNEEMDITIKNKYGQPIKINGHSMDGRSTGSANSPYVPATFFHG